MGQSSNVCLVLLSTLLLILDQSGAKLPQTVKIGILLDETDFLSDSILQQTIQASNYENVLFPHTRIVPVIRNVKSTQSFHAVKAGCSLISEGVWAIFGPSSPSIAWLIRSCAYHINIPHLAFHWDYRSPKRVFQTDIEQSNFTLNLYPDLSTVGSAFADLVEREEWTKFTILYEENQDLIRVKDLLRLTSNNPNVQITIRQYVESKYKIKKLFKAMKRAADSNFVLSVKAERVLHILREAQQNGFLSEYHSYIIANLDAHALNMTEFQSVSRQPRIIALTMVDPSGQIILPSHSTQLYSSPVISDQVQSQHHQVNNPLILEELYNNDNMKKTAVKFSLQASLLYDSIKLFTRALNQSIKNSGPSLPPTNCETGKPWAFGQSIIGAMKTDNFKGYTGLIKFNEAGIRSNINMELIKLTSDGFLVESSWSKAGKFKKPKNSGIRDIYEQMKSIIFKVTTSSNEPYVMWKTNYEKFQGNEQFEGYCVDLLREISLLIPFNFTIIHRIPKESYGKRELNGSWTGLIRQLMDREADLAITDLTITQERQSVVDFTTPFMSLGIAIMYKKPSRPPENYFSFLKPFSIQVWLYVVTAFLGVSLLMYIISRISPYEWGSRHSHYVETTLLENQFSLGNCLWFSMGSVMQQGSDLSPRALSTRTLASAWFFFTLIMVSSYTANLAAVLTVSRMEDPISSVEDLARQSDISYGCKAGGSTCEFFQKSNHSTYQKMWSFMVSQRPSVFVEDNAEGIERTKLQKYAFLMESPSIEYQVQKNCDLMKVGDLLDQKHYGIALPAGSPYRSALNHAILTLHENGKLNQLKKKWWVEHVRRTDGIVCPEEQRSSYTLATEMDIHRVGGVFLLLITGTGIGCLIVIIEFIWKVKVIARQQQRELEKKKLVKLEDSPCNHLETVI